MAEQWETGEGDVYYRYFELIYDGRIHICCEQFIVDKVTPKGVWIATSSTRKFILNSSGKKYAWPTLEEAMNSYLHRRRKQHAILISQLERCNQSIAEATKLIANSDYRTLYPLQRDDFYFRRLG